MPESRGCCLQRGGVPTLLEFLYAGSLQYVARSGVGEEGVVELLCGESARPLETGDDDNDPVRRDRGGYCLGGLGFRIRCVCERERWHLLLTMETILLWYSSVARMSSDAILMGRTGITKHQLVWVCGGRGSSYAWNGR